MVFRQGPAGKVRPIATLNDVMARFAALSDMQRADHAHVHGTVLAVVMDWMIRLPAGDARDKALERLGEAAELACAALPAD
jgi:hypothetical protein